ncbi:MAG: 50S ribosomal protein L10 [Candidatus Bathyarchaeota archaeon]|jgi:large subunit ribosomal protein L10|nr:50S ribosomal protein L10 [Candidatus Bathyarchaeota archaeon A05DMB-3]MDH7606372.1 50S ribosomal protein L10 [Candidatus Bathyarchaeota archaeon]
MKEGARLPSQQVLEEKISEVEEITKLLKQYRVVGIANLQKVRAPQLQEFKRKLAADAYMRVIKNTIMKRAIENCGEKPELEKLEKYLTGPNVFLFTNANPFKLALLLEKGKVRTTAKAGDIASFDVIVPAGNTGQPPGPIISQLNAVGLPTRIEAGSVWITKDTLVARKGDVISERLASVLSKLGIKPVEAGLIMKVVYDEGLIIEGEQLKIDLDEMRRQIENAHGEAFKLSLGVAYPTRENIQALIRIAHQEAYALSLGAAVPTKETIKDLIRKAYAEMLSLSMRIPNLEGKTKQD